MELAKIEAVAKELELDVESVVLNSLVGQYVQNMVKAHEAIKPKQAGEVKKAQVMSAVKGAFPAISDESIDSLVELAVEKHAPAKKTEAELEPEVAAAEQENAQ